MVCWRFAAPKHLEAGHVETGGWLMSSKMPIEKLGWCFHVFFFFFFEDFLGRTTIIPND